jgi:hypothetical protein
VDGSIKWWYWCGGDGGRFGTEEEDSTSTRAGFCFGKVGCIAVNVEAHVAGVKKDAGIRMAGGIVKEVYGRFGGGKCTFGLGGSKTAKGNEHGIINVISFGLRGSD